MKIIVAIDDDLGMMFNHRRQSQDSKLREKILELSKESTLWMNAYSRKQFADDLDNIRVSETFLTDAKDGEYCFVENSTIAEYASKIEEIILFQWNRRYPGDIHLDFLPENNNMTCTKNEEFQGNSHDKISMGVWVRNV